MQRANSLHILTTALAGSAIALYLGALLGGPMRTGLWISPVLLAGAAVGACIQIRSQTRSLVRRELSDMKNDFVSMISHELRTPLASIKAYIEMLIDGEAVDPRMTSEFYDVIQTEANRLGRLIDNILSASRIESGLVKPDKHRLQLTPIIREAIASVSQQASRRKIQLCQDLATGVDQVNADRSMLLQALSDLLNHFIKQTPAHATVTASTLVDEANGKIVVRLSDNGSSQGRQAVPSLLEKLRHGNCETARSTALSLGLVQQVVETMHHGRLFVRTGDEGRDIGFELKLCDPDPK